jgi:hypothetical protein
MTDIRDLKKKIQQLPLTVAHTVAQRAAPEMTRLTKAAYSGGKTAYGGPRPTGTGGRRLGLVRTGATEQSVGFHAAGTVIRCVLGTKYAKYLIGKYQILPSRTIPRDWMLRLRQITQEALQ